MSASSPDVDPEEPEPGMPDNGDVGWLVPLAGHVQHTVRRIFSSLQHRNYRLFFIGQLISTMGTWIQQPVMQWLVWEWTDSEFMLGALTAVGSLPVLLLSPIGGLVAERFEKRSILMVTQPLLFIAPVTLAVLMLVNPQAREVWLLFSVALFSGTIMAFDVPARQSFVVDLVDRPSVPNAIALNSFLFNTSRMVGPVIGMALISISPAVCFAANGCSYLALVACLLLMTVPPRLAQARAGGRNHRMHHPWGGFFYAWRQKDIRMTLLLLAGATIFGWSLMSQLAAFTTRVFLQDRGEFGVFMTTFGAGALVGAVAMAYLSSYPDRRRLILAGASIFVVSVTLFLWSRYLWAEALGFSVDWAYHVALLPMFLAGLGLLMCMSAINSHIQMEVSHRFHGRVMGVYAMFFGGMMPLGSILTGYLAENLVPLLSRLPGCEGLVEQLPAGASLVLAVQMNIVILAAILFGAWHYWRRLHRPMVAQ
jgi:MFS family permease